MTIRLFFFAVLFAASALVFAVVPACGRIEGDVEEVIAANPNAVQTVTSTVASLVDSASSLLEQAIAQAGENYIRVVVQDPNGGGEIVTDVAQELRDVKAALDKIKK